MVRIAKIRFSGSRTSYDYFCPDKTIEEGDVVFLEGKENPSYVYEIVEVADSESKATKKVLSKAEENTNVTLSSKYMDITKAKQECIVNSLGTHIQEFGNICGAIFHTAQSKELEDFIKNNAKGNIFDIKVTDAGKLPSKYIINIVMPYKYDDPKNEQLRKAFTLVIDKAIELKAKSIAIPYIGTGANGYEYEDIHQALNDVMFNYQYKKDIAIDITSVRYHARSFRRDSDYYIEEERRNRREKNRNIRNQEDFISSNCIDASFERLRRKREPFDIDFSEGIDNVGKIQDVIRRNYNKNDELKVDSLYSPADFIRAAIKKAGGYAKIPLINEILNNDARKNIAKFSKIIRKEEIYSSAVILKLNFTQIIQYMEISGYTFSPVTKNDLDIEVFKYIVNNNGFTKSQDEIDDYFYSLGDEISDIVINYEAPKRTPKKKPATV